VFLDLIEPICFLPLVTLLHAFLKLDTYLDTFRIGLWLVVLLSPAVLNDRSSLPSFVLLSLACGSVESCCLPSIGM
jgi:hypothetical protein